MYTFDYRDNQEQLQKESPVRSLHNKRDARRIAAFLTGPNAFEQTWAPREKQLVSQSVMDSLDSPHHQYWYIEDAHMIIAALGIRENKYGSGGYEMDADYMAVHREYRRIGLCTLLLKRAEAFVKQNGGRYIHVLSCDIDSYAPARAFYARNKYIQVGAIPNYYVTGEGRVDYVKSFTEKSSWCP